MEGDRYNNREINLMFEEIKHGQKDQTERLQRIEVQTTMHNGRMKKIEKTLLIVGCVSGTLLIANGSELVQFLMSII